MKATLLAATFASVCVSSAFAETIVVRGSDCNRLVQSHKPAGADYVPGVDVSGKPVVSADVGGGYNMTLPETIDIQIGVDVADRLARRDAKKKGTAEKDLQRKVLPYEGKVALGTLSIKGNEAFWNGERMLPQDQVALAEACRQSMTTGKQGALPTAKPSTPKPKP
jgi:opacity protein-like surface antigen